jgi:hypothetical protein
MKNKYLRESATSWTALAFFIVALSGVMMFFHFYDHYVEHLHEWLGLFFIAAVFLHVFYNFKSMKSYFTKKLFLASAVVLLGVSLIFIAGETEKKESPKKAMLQALLKAPIESSSKILGVSMEQSSARLIERGLIFQESQSAEEIAKANGISPYQVISTIVKK